MKIPLIANAIIDEDTGGQMLEIWTNGKKQIIQAPIEPYIITKKQLEFSTLNNVKEEIIKCKFLSDLKSVRAFKYSFPNSNYIVQINKSLSKPGLDRHQKVVSSVTENHVPYMNRILIDMPDYFLRYANVDNLTVMFLDIETLRENYIDKKKIISIAYGIYNGTEYEEIQSSQNTNEKELLEWFLQAVEKTDVDIICGYYHRGFDLPRIIDRCKANKLNYHRLGREKGVKYHVNRRFHETNVTIPGRVLYDLLDSVISDQTLFGLKNKKMKTICEHFGIEGSGWVKEQMDEQTANIPTEILKAHNEDDIKRTIGLWKVYWNNVLTQSEMFNIPLNMVAEGASQTLISNLFLGRGLFHQGIMSDGSNRDRYPEIFNRTREKGDTSNYEAALVDIYQTGLFKPLFKADFKSYYPNIMIAVNASPDTTKLIKLLPYKDEYKKEIKKNAIIYYIPDKVIKKTCVIAVRTDKDGFLRKELSKIKKDRYILKEKSKTCSKEEFDAIESMQYNYKVLMNIPSGKNGEKTARYGAIPVSILTVGIARKLIKELKDYLDEKYGNICIEVDTDGLYTSEEPDIDEINEFVKEKAYEYFGISDSSALEIDTESFNAGYFIKMKNYILENTNGEMTFHGVSMKSSRHPGIFVKARDILAVALLNEEKDIKKIINKILKMEQYSLSDFTLRNTLHKPLNEYSKGSLQRKIGNQALARGIPVDVETQIEYVRGKETWVIAPNAKVEDIDKNYYYKVVEKLCTALGFEKLYKTRNIKTLDTWF